MLIFVQHLNIAQNVDPEPFPLAFLSSCKLTNERKWECAFLCTENKENTALNILESGEMFLHSSLIELTTSSRSVYDIVEKGRFMPGCDCFNSMIELNDPVIQVLTPSVVGLYLHCTPSLLAHLVSPSPFEESHLSWQKHNLCFPSPGQKTQ